MAETLVTAAGLRLETLRVAGLDMSSPASVARFATQLPAAIAASRRIIRRFGADAVIGGAGYVSAPVVIAAATLRLPVVLLEQNAVPGRATRMLARFGRAVAASYPQTAARLHGVRVVVTGNPIRPEVLATPRRPLGERCEHLLVMGGSQGARTINRAVAGSVEQLLESHPALRVTHQTGRLDIDEMRQALAALPGHLRHRWTLAPFIDDVGAAIVAADVVLMRAGGSSLAECAALQRPMILVPYPHAGDHQRFNAAPYASAGAALVIPDADCTPDAVAAQVTALFEQPQRWRAMAEATASLARPDAAARVVALLDELVDAPARIPA